MEISIVNLSDVQKFDNWSGSFWSKYKSEIDSVLRMSKQEMIDLNVDLVTKFAYAVRKNVNKIAEAVKKDGSMTSSLVLRLSSAIEELENGKSCVNAIKGNGSVESLRQLTVLSIYIKNNVIDQEYEKLKESLDEILKEIRHIEEMKNIPNFQIL